MKKIFFFLLFFSWGMTVFALENSSQDNSFEEKNKLELAPSARSAILFEADSGEVLYEKNADEKLAMASMTKMMTLLLIMEEIEKGNLKWDEMVTASEYAASMGGSQIFLEVGEQMSVEDLVKGICIASGNDASVAMAEKIAGTEEKFVSLMNERAKKLQLTNTHFANACGLDSDDHYSSARDMGLIAKELVKHSAILKYTSTYEDYLRKGTDKSFWLVNTNKLVRYYQGVDGLKTGYTKNAGYCITTTAERNHLRFITVVMGETTSSVRNREVTSMLDYGFNRYQKKKIFLKNDVLGEGKVLLGKKSTVKVVPMEDAFVLENKDEGKKDIRYEVKLSSLKAPLRVGDVVGEVSLKEDGKVFQKISLTVQEEVPKIGFFLAYCQEWLSMLKG